MAANNSLQRRDFHKLALASLGGVAAAGSVGGTASAAQKKKKSKIAVDPGLLLSEPHTCRGLNTCKTKGAGGGNACAGQGACASVKAHVCAGKNDCKGQGGCGGYPGQNTCKGKGHCAVKLSKATWKLARKQFEELMKGMGKKVGKAPKA